MGNWLCRYPNLGSIVNLMFSKEGPLITDSQYPVISSPIGVSNQGVRFHLVLETSATHPFGPFELLVAPLPIIPRLLGAFSGRMLPVFFRRTVDAAPICRIRLIACDC